MKTCLAEYFGNVHPDERLVINDQNGNSTPGFETFTHLLATQSVTSTRTRLKRGVNVAQLE